METNKELKVLSKDEQIAVAKDILKGYPKAQKVIVASDGQAFIADVSDIAAKNHANVNVYGKELKLVVFTRDELMVKAEGSNVKKVQEKVVAPAKVAKPVKGTKPAESAAKQSETTKPSE